MISGYCEQLFDWGFVIKQSFDFGILKRLNFQNKIIDLGSLCKYKIKVNTSLFR